MPDLFHGDAIEKALAELKTAAEQAQIAAAAATEVLQHADALIERVNAAMDRLMGPSA